MTTKAALWPSTTGGKPFYIPAGTRYASFRYFLFDTIIHYAKNPIFSILNAPEEGSLGT